MFSNWIRCTNALKKKKNRRMIPKFVRLKFLHLECLAKRLNAESLMAWQIRIRAKARSIITTVPVFRPFPVSRHLFRCFPLFFISNSVGGSPRTSLCSHRSTSFFSGLEKVEYSGVGLRSSLKEKSETELDASTSSLGPARAHKSFKGTNLPTTQSGVGSVDQMKQRFLHFKQYKYLKETERFQTLAKMQSPKFMVIACVDSRVCPSNILGFQPGEAFMVRNVANLVPALENGPTETNAALEFAVNTLEVEYIFVIGHSSCAGIRALMSMQDGKSSSFVEKWVANAEIAKIRTKADTIHLSFDQQCEHCKKESINNSLLNLLTYPWIEDKVRKGMLSIHGGYYDFSNCTFEKWTLDFEGSSFGRSSRFSVKDKTFWC